MVYGALNNILRVFGGVAEMKIEPQKPRARGLTPHSEPEQKNPRNRMVKE